MKYTKHHQDADRAFLVGANYGRATERKRIIDMLKTMNVEDVIDVLADN